MECPRCGAPTNDQPECPRCGVVVAKAAVARRPPARAPVRPPARVPGTRRHPAVVPVLLLAVAGLVAFAVRRGAAPAQTRQRAATPAPSASGAPKEEAPLAGPPPELTLPARRAIDLPPPIPSITTTANRPEAEALARKLGSRVPIDAADLASAERLYAEDSAARPLLVAVLVAAARSEHSSRRYARAAELLQRATALDPAAEGPLRMLLAVQSDAQDWPAVERTALELQRLGAGDAETIATLAYALVRQDRTGEAIELLTRRLERGHDPLLSSLLARLQRDASAETHLRQQTLSHFHVRYDGEAHEDVGRELLRVLERHYATLARTLDHEPSSPIPVLLLSREAYYDGTGAPAWSGGRYDTFDGRVRIPIGGLTTSLTPELELTALHELTHAFVADRSRGLAPRELQEGLAQLMEGKRLSGLGEDTLRALASGRAGGVGGYYLLSLGFVEDLVAQRGQGGINDLLAAIARTGNVDAAFREVYGQDYQGSIAAAVTRLRSRYGA